MDVRFFLVISLGSGALVLLARPYRNFSLAIGLAGLAGCIAAALVMNEAATTELLGGRLVATPFLRWFLVIGSAAGLATCLVARATRWQPDLPAVTLAALGGSALALSVDSLPIAVLAATAAGALGLAVFTAPAEDAPADEAAGERTAAERPAVAYLEVLAIAGALAALSAAWLIAPAGVLPVDAFAGGAAALTMGLALALRFGAVPFHGPAGRIVRGAVPLGIPLVLGWLPVLLFLVALSWSQTVFLPQQPDLETIRPVLAVLGAGSLLFGALGTVGRPPESDDLQHVVSYGIVQDAGLFLLAFAAFNAAAWEPARTWSIYFAVSKTALAAWMTGLIAMRGSAAVSHLEGWARRSPILTIALLGALAAGLGVPGLGSWDARLAIIQSLPIRPLRWVAYAGWALAYLPFLRLLWVGLRAPGVPLPDDQRPRLRLAETRPARGDLRTLVTFTLASARLSRLAIAIVLVLALGLGAGVLAVGPGGLTDAAGTLPEPLLPAPSPSP